GWITLVVMNDDLVDELWSAQFVAERRRFRRSRAIIEPKRFALARLQVADHRHDRSDSDAPGNKQECLAARWQGEMIDRTRGWHLVVFLHPVNEARRSAAAVAFTLDRNQVAMALAGVVAQGKLANEPVRRTQRHVGTGGEVRQRRAVAPAQVIEMNPFGDRFGAMHSQD